MLKLHIFIVLLVVSPSLGLLETLLRAENNCYAGCHANYVEHLANLNACKKGCDYKIQNEHCVSQCKSNIADGQGQASCLMGCSLSQPAFEKQRPRAIILIRLRERPVFQLPSSNSNSAQNLNDLIRKFKPAIPVIKSTDEIYSDTLSKQLPISHEKIDSSNNQFQKFINQLSSIVGKQPKIPIWILVGIFLLSSAILWKMIASLCCHKPKYYNLSIHGQELAFDNVDQKEKLQSNERNI